MSLQQGLSGLNGASKALDVVSNNVANSSTVGFKSSQAQFSDVFAASLAGAGSGQIGIGTNLSTVAQRFTQGNIGVSNNPLDLAINGNGFFRMSQAGEVTYTRNGQLFADASGNIVNAEGRRLQGYGVDTLGNIVPGVFVDMTMGVVSGGNPTATTEAIIELNIDSRETIPANGTFSITDPTSFNASTSATVFDTLGNPHVLGMYLVKTATPNEWDLYTNLDGGAATINGASPSLTFDTAGQLTTTMPLAQSFAVTTGATTPLAFDLDLTGTTQFGANFAVERLVQDGYAPGSLAGISIASDGILQGRFSNGQTTNLGQVILSTFDNPNGLTALGGNQWAETRPLVSRAPTHPVPVRWGLFSLPVLKSPTWI